MRSSLAALLTALGPVSAATYQGFNYAATLSDNTTPMQLSDYTAMMTAAKGLAGTNGAFSSARLYTMIQGGTTDDPTSAIQAAINTGTSLLLGLWASGGETGVQSEINALKTAMQQYGSKFTSLVAGISVGSEDLYRTSPTGIKNKSGIGAEPSDIANYIKQLRGAIAGTALASAPVGHVDTWTAWVNSSNAEVVEACDFIGMDAYPYFQTTEANSISDGNKAFFSAFDQTKSAAGGKPVWITETGWPISGKTANLAVPSVQNAAQYWQDVGCEVFGSVNTWWFTLDDSDPTTPSPSFSIISSLSAPKPLFNLQCSAKSKSNKAPKPHTHSAPTKPKHHHAAVSHAAHSKPVKLSSSSVKTPHYTVSSTPIATPSNSGPSTPLPSSGGGAGGSSAGGNPLPQGTSAAQTAASTGGAVAPTAKIAGLGMGVLAVGAALVL